MAITRYSTDGGDLTKIKAAIDASGLFGATSIDNKTLTINDGDDNAVIKITVDGYLSYTDSVTVAIKNANGWVTYATFNGGEPDYVWTTATSVLIELRGSSNRHQPIILTKTNNDKYAVIANNSNVYTETNNMLAVSESDTSASTSSLNEFNFSQTTRTYSVMVPATTETGGSTASYTPGAFYMPFTSITPGELVRVVLNGKVYLTDGIWAVLDEDL